MNEVIKAIRAKYPAYASMPDDELTLRVGDKYPQYLDHPEFKTDYDKYRLQEAILNTSVNTVPPPPTRTGQEIAAENIRRIKGEQLQAQLNSAKSGAEFTQAFDDALTWTEGVVKGMAYPLWQTEELAGSVAGKDIPSSFRPSTYFTGPGPQLPKPEGKSPSTADQVITGVAQAGLDFAWSLFQHPEYLAIGGMPAAAQKTVLAGFAGQMAASAPAQLVEANNLAREGKYQEAAQVATSGAGGLLLAGLIAKHAQRTGIQSIQDVEEKAVAARMSPERADLIARNLAAPGTMRPTEIQAWDRPMAEQPLGMVMNKVSWDTLFGAIPMPLDFQASPELVQLANDVMLARQRVAERTAGGKLPAGPEAPETRGFLQTAEERIGQRAETAEATRIKQPTRAPDKWFEIQADEKIVQLADALQKAKEREALAQQRAAELGAAGKLEPGKSTEPAKPGESPTPQDEFVVANNEVKAIFNSLLETSRRRRAMTETGKLGWQRPAEEMAQNNLTLTPRTDEALAETTKPILETPEEKALAQVDIKQETLPKEEPAIAPAEPSPVEQPKPVVPEVPKAPEVTPVKEPWQMTKDEFWKKIGIDPWRSINPNAHREHIQIALKEGKPVSPEVLADYPDLKTEKPSPPAVTQGETTPVTAPGEVPLPGAAKASADTLAEPAISNISAKSSESQTTLSILELQRLINKQRGIVKRVDPYKKKGKQAIAKLAELEDQLKQAKESTPIEPTNYSRETILSDIRLVKPTMAADMGERVKLRNGEIWEYKGISGYKADNLNRVNGWEKVQDVSKPKPTPPTEPMALGAGIPIPKILEEAGAGAKQIVDDFKSAIRPPTKSPEAVRTSGTMRDYLAELARKDVVAREQFKKALKAFNQMPDPERLDFIQRMETGQPQPAGLQPFADAMRQALDQRAADVQALGTGKLQSLVEDYFPHIWEDPTGARAAFDNLWTKRPLRGSGSFLKERTLDYVSQGLAMGLRLKYGTNPVESVLARLHEMDRYVMGQKVINELKRQNLLKFSRSASPPQGWERINDPLGTVVQFRQTPTGSREKIVRGYYYAPKDAARVINNYLSPGLQNYAWYKALRYSGNTLNQVQLGLSGFHLMFTALDSATSKTALGIEQVASGKIVPGIGNVLKGAVGNIVVNPLENFLRGNRVLREYTKPGSVGGEYTAIVDALIKAGGRAKMEMFYKNSSIEKFWEAWRQGRIDKGILHIPSAVIEYAAKPVMEILVPRMKLGIMADFARWEFARRPQMTTEEMRNVMGRAWDSVDNRMGQMVYDNLFWNRTFKDLLMVAVRSVGWNFGTFRELGGAVKDLATLKSRLNDPKNLMTHRMAYAVALPITVGVAGAIYQYLRTGTGPQELMDYFAPKTGEKNTDGTDERVQLPSYMKDIMAMERHPLKTIGHKSHPLAVTIWDMLQNKDFFGTKIANEDEPLVQQALDEAKYLAKQYVPFSLQSATKRVRNKGEIGPILESAVGFVPAAKELQRSPAMNRMVEMIIEKKPEGGISEEDRARSDMRQALRQQLAAGNKEAMWEAVKEGTLTPSQSERMIREMKQPKGLPLFKRLSIDEAKVVWGLASEQERKDWKSAMRIKILNAMEQRPKEAKALRDYWRSVKDKKN